MKLTEEQIREVQKAHQAVANAINEMNDAGSRLRFTKDDEHPLYRRAYFLQDELADHLMEIEEYMEANNISTDYSF